MLQKEDPEHGWDLIQDVEMLICDTEVLPCLCVTGDSHSEHRATALLQVFGLWNASVPEGGSRGMRKSLAPLSCQLCLLANAVPRNPKEHLCKVLTTS